MPLRIEDLKKIIKGETRTDAASLDAYSVDASLFRLRPAAIVAPRDTADLSALVAYAARERKKGEDVSLTARAAGTDMTGGPLTASVVVDFLPNFSRIKEVTSETVTAEPGVYYRDMDAATKKLDRIMPGYPASRDLCTIGGMTANNSGGEKTLRYGKTVDYIRELKMVLSDGKEHAFRKLTLGELVKKKKLKGFEGELYRRVYALVEENDELLQAAKPHVTKSSSGYALWDVLDREKGTFDMTRLLCGSQGTLGLITEVTFSLVRPREHSRLLVIFLNDLQPLAELTDVLRKYNPESLESYDDHTFKIALRLFPQIVKRLKGNIFMLGIRFLPEFFAVLTHGVPKLVLMAEFTADSDEEAVSMARQAEEAVAPFKLKTRVTASSADAEKYWTVRRESFNLLRQHVRGTRTAPFIEDLVVAPESLPEFLPKLYALLDRYPLTYTIAGHVGDGNFHIIPLMDLHDPHSEVVIRELMEKAQRLVWEYRGSNTGEHNDGILRTPYLKEMYGDKVYALFEEVKRIFDPQNIFNPGKKVGDDVDYLYAHIDTRKT
jgi:FAD/FMN-containing dehydrogenase